MNLPKKLFLLTRSVSLLSENRDNCSYDAKMDINFSSSNGKNTPTVTLHNNLTTQSKTFAAPGDDDPDVEAENCY